MIIFLIYITPIILAILIAYKKSLNLVKSLRGNAESEKDITSEVNKHTQALDMSIDELRKLRPFVIYQLWELVWTIDTIYLSPITMLRIAISMRWGSRVWWRSPINLYDLWTLGSISLSYYYANKGNIYTAMALAIIVGNHALDGMLWTFEKKDGILNIFHVPRHKVNVRDIIETGFSFILSFAAIYYIIGLANPNSFSKQLTILNSIYFSVITIATVGYGDIIPITGYAKTITIIQVLLGILYILFVISIFMAVYIRNQEQEKNRVKSVNSRNGTSN